MPASHYSGMPDVFIDFYAFKWLNKGAKNAGMAKLADAPALGAGSARNEGSSPSPGTNK